MQRQEKGGLSTSLPWDWQWRVRGGESSWAEERMCACTRGALLARC